jgi:TPR repeat protein
MTATEKCFSRIACVAAYCLTLAALMFALPTARATELHTQVAEVLPNSHIKLALPAGHDVHVGDDVTLSTQMINIGWINLQTRWRVDSVGGGFATAAPLAGSDRMPAAGVIAVHSKPQVGFRAVIVAQARSQPAAAAGALDTLRKRAEQGDVNAMGMLGLAYASGTRLSGQAMAPNPQEAARWLRMAAERKDIASTCMLATLYQTQNDKAAALHWMRQAAEAGAAACMYGYGMMLLNGVGVAKDAPQGLTWIKKAADTGLPAARLQLAESYLFGTRTPAEIGKAQSLFLDLAKEGVPSAMFYSCVLLGNAQPQEALSWCRKAAATGDTQAMYQIATVYLTGAGVAADLAEARRWYTRAAEAGEPESMLFLAVMLERGIGGPQSTPQAARWAIQGLRAHSAQVDAILLNGRAWSPAFWKELQTRLHQAGLYNGPINGAMTKDTVRAISQLLKHGA